MIGDLDSAFSNALENHAITDLVALPPHVSVDMNSALEGVRRIGVNGDTERRKCTSDHGLKVAVVNELGSDIGRIVFFRGTNVWWRWPWRCTCAS